MGYMDNSYSNSNNGGSVNSQDSIWQMKSAAANGVGQPYDLAGYATTESDYPTHPHYLPQREDYRESHNLSRQQFCSEPFATVVKSQKHVGEWYSLVHPPFPQPSSTTFHRPIIALMRTFNSICPKFSSNLVIRKVGIEKCFNVFSTVPRLKA